MTNTTESISQRSGLRSMSPQSRCFCGKTPRHFPLSLRTPGEILKDLTLLFEKQHGKPAVGIREMMNRSQIEKLQLLL
jgi:hypothetical protein